MHRAAAEILAVLKAVFVLDPVPDRMRQYVRRNDTLLRRNGENLSAAVEALLRNADAR